MRAVTIQEHYDIHYEQGDWYACLRIAEKMKLNPEEISKLARQHNLKRIADGTHNLLKRADGTSVTSDRVSDGTNLFLGPENNKKMLENGTHSSQAKIADGSHHFLINHPNSGGKISKKLLAEGKHNLLGKNNPNKNMPKITCPHCGKTGGRNLMKRYHFDNCKFKNK